MSIKQLGTQSLIYASGHIITRSISLLLLPLYTNVFSLENFGVISLIYTFLGFMNVILHYGLDASLLKHYVPADQDERKSILTNTYISFLSTTALFIIILILLRNHVSTLLFGINIPKAVLLVSGILFFDILWAIHVLILRAEEKSILFSGINLFNVLSSLGLNLYFVFYLQLGIYGVLLSNIITSGCIFLATFPIILKRISLNTISIYKWKKLIKFGYPFLFAGIFSMILELSDRYILLYLTDIETVGLYSAGYKIGMLMTLVLMGFNMAWQPYFLKKNIKEKKYINQVTTIVISIMFFLWILLLIWSNDLIRLQFWNSTFFGEQYWDSIQIIPIIALAYIFHAIYLLQLPGVYLLNKPGWIAWVRGIGAVVNIILNFLLIPEFGIMGAASATCLSFMLVAVIFYFINKKIFPISYNWKKLGMILITTGFIYLIQDNLKLDCSLKILLSISYPVIMIFSGVINMNQIRNIIAN